MKSQRLAALMLALALFFASGTVSAGISVTRSNELIEYSFLLTIPRIQGLILNIPARPLRSLYSRRAPLFLSLMARREWVEVTL